MIRNGTEGGSASPTYDGKPDLQEVLEHYGVYVTHSGKWLCCFHDETIPSLSVDLNEQLYKCFSCGAAGDAWTAIETKEGLDHKDARAFAATHGFERGGDDSGSGPVPRSTGWGNPRVSRKQGSKRSGSWSPSWASAG